MNKQTLQTPYCVIGGGLVGCLLGLVAPKRTLVCDSVFSNNANSPTTTRIPVAVSLANMRWIAHLLALNLGTLLAETDAVPMHYMQLCFGQHKSRLENVTDTRSAYIVNYNALDRLAKNALLSHSCTVNSRYLYHQTVNNKHTVHTEEKQTIQTKLLLAADGAHSRVRLFDNPTLITAPCSHTALVAEVRFAHKQPTHTAWQLFTQHIIGLLPLDANCHTALIIWSAPDEQAQALMRSNKEELQAEYKRRTKTHLPDVVFKQTPKAFALKQQYVAQWQAHTQPPVLYFGDAAHSVHPLAGQGLNLALTEVRIWQQAVQKHRTDASAVNDFRRMIKYRTLPIMQSTQALYRMSTWHNSVRTHLYQSMATFGDLL